MAATDDRARAQRFTLPAALLVWALVLLRVVHAFGPETEINDFPYSSDTAIPVLMANDDRPFSPFSLYYYSADRFGAWAWALPALIHRHTGLWWTPHMLFVLQASWVFLGAIVIGALCPRDRYAVPLIYLFVLCLQRDGRFMLFEVGQVYAWIVTSLLVTWLCLRRLFRVEALRARGRHEQWMARSFLLAALLLTLWSSATAAPYVTALLCLEAFRAWLANPPAVGGDGTPARRGPSGYSRRLCSSTRLCGGSTWSTASANTSRTPTGTFRSTAASSVKTCAGISQP